jgi:hypothetical protein
MIFLVKWLPLLVINGLIVGKNKKDIPNLEFKEISDEFVHRQINKTNVKKATGRDGISAKLLKLAKPVIAKPIF